MGTLFQARCDSFLRYLRVVGKIALYSIPDEEMAVVNCLIDDSKVRLYRDNWDGSTVRDIGSPLYGGEAKLSDLVIDPFVLSLAAESPANEWHIKVYRKNLPQSA